MKVGLRTPNLKKSIKARTTGRAKRKLKRAINPVYGRKGVGYIKDPERAVKNRFYHKLTVDPLDPIKHPADFEAEDTEVSFPVWQKVTGILFGITFVVGSGKFIFSHVVDIRWIIAAGIFFVAYVLSRIFDL